MPESIEELTGPLNEEAVDSTEPVDRVIALLLDEDLRALGVEIRDELAPLVPKLVDLAKRFGAFAVEVEARRSSAVRLAPHAQEGVDALVDTRLGLPMIWDAWAAIIDSYNEAENAVVNATRLVDQPGT